MKIAIMQPYFMPYAGYFRLFCAVDLFVIFDCVQFIRRGWIHRNRLPNQNGELQWLTLPLKKSPQSTLIKDISFVDDANEIWSDRLQAFPQLFAKKNLLQNEFFNQVLNLGHRPIDYLLSTLEATCQLLNLPFKVQKSSELHLPNTLKGEEKIIAIAKMFGATSYVNLSGGGELYSKERFDQENITLNFLTPFQGSYDSILNALMTHDPAMIRQSIVSQTLFE